MKGRALAKVPWRYKCFFDWLSNDSLSEGSDKTLFFSVPIISLCVRISDCSVNLADTAQWPN